jgi:hypothetical protein
MLVVDPSAVSCNVHGQQRISAKLSKPACKKPILTAASVLCCSCSREYRVWDAAEENALKAGVKKHGLGAWERIRTDPDFTILM